LLNDVSPYCCPPFASKLLGRRRRLKCLTRQKKKTKSYTDITLQVGVRRDAEEWPNRTQ
jgi:hypothetical protein